VRPDGDRGDLQGRRRGHPEAAAFEKGNKYHDPDSDPESPTWYTVDIEAVKEVSPPLERTALAAQKPLAKMELLRRGSRLSVQPVTEAEWRCVLGLAGIAKDPW
jgi:predicted RNA-binding protein with PUA-like domain